MDVGCTIKYKTKTVVKGYDIPAVGSCWIIFSGHWVEDVKYGRQFETEFCEVEKPHTEKGVINYFADLKIGIGASRAKAIYAHFGEGALYILEQDPKKILEVSAVPQKTAYKYLEICGVKTARQTLRQFFCGMPGYTEEVITKIIERLGENALEDITQNPYKLYSIVGYNATEHLACRMEHIPADFPARLSCAVSYTLSQNALVCPSGN